MVIIRNIRKQGDVGNLNFCTFTQNCNGLISWSFEIPASAYCHPLPRLKNILHKRNGFDFLNNKTSYLRKLTDI